MLEEIVRWLFGSNGSITKEAMRAKLNSELKYLFKSQDLRARLQRKVFMVRAKTNAEEDALLERVTTNWSTL